MSYVSLGAVSSRTAPLDLTKVVLQASANKSPQPTRSAPAPVIQLPVVPPPAPVIQLPVVPPPAQGQGILPGAPRPDIKISLPLPPVPGRGVSPVPTPAPAAAATTAKQFPYGLLVGGLVIGGVILFFSRRK
jgi:hypothetical protein